jgi:hypothetical protein
VRVHHGYSGVVMSFVRSNAIRIACVLLGVMLAVGIAIGLIWGTDKGEEWGWYLTILGSGGVFLAAVSVDTWTARTSSVLLGALTIWTFGAGIAVDLADQNESFGLAPDAIGVFATGVVVFFGILSLSAPANAVNVTDGAMRNAIGASLLVVFAAILAIGLFHPPWTHDPVGDKFADKLIWAFAAVVGFYFTSSAAIEAVNARQRPTDD